MNQADTAEDVEAVPTDTDITAQVEDDDPDASFAVQLDDRLRDALTKVGIAPNDTMSDAELGDLLFQFAELARRAQAAGDRLYCWCCP